MDEYLNTLLEQIRCKKAWPYIRLELQSHIEDQIAENIQAGMDIESAEREAVRDMGDPVETGISLDHIHKPQAAWKLLFLIGLLSVTGIAVHMIMDSQITGNVGADSLGYAADVGLGVAVMLIIYHLDYTSLARFSKAIAVALCAMCLYTLCFGNMVNGMRYFGIPGGHLVSMQAIILFYIPVYGGVLYQYHGSDYKGVFKALIWMLAPIFLIWQLPHVTTAGLLLICMLVMLTMAIYKGWFYVKKKRAIAALWSVFLFIPAGALFVLYAGNYMKLYQKERVQAYLPGNSEEFYPITIRRTFLTQNKFWGSSGVDVAELIPDYNGHDILSCLSSVCGMIAAILICCILSVLIFAVFHAVIRQKNQLGWMMGCGCGMVFLISSMGNIFENMGIFPPTATFLPFLSAGGSYIFVSYGLMGIVLSVYRYKNIYPGHLKAEKRQHGGRITD